LTFAPFGPLDLGRIKDGDQKMTDLRAPSQFDADESGKTHRGVRPWTRDAAVFQITVTPPLRSDGVASMLVALGDAGIGVTQVVPTNDDTGMYRMTVNVSSTLAAKVLIGIGCVVNSIQSSMHTYGDQVGQDQEVLPYNDYVQD
jgi:hypothetical protein